MLYWPWRSPLSVSKRLPGNAARSRRVAAASRRCPLARRPPAPVAPIDVPSCTLRSKLLPYRFARGGRHHYRSFPAGCRDAVEQPLDQLDLPRVGRRCAPRSERRAVARRCAGDRVRGSPQLAASAQRPPPPRRRRCRSARGRPALPYFCTTRKPPAACWPACRSIRPTPASPSCTRRVTRNLPSSARSRPAATPTPRSTSSDPARGTRRAAPRGIPSGGGLDGRRKS